ncbi:DUF6415 family natural product biosynthesis protein [Streptomyces sp. ISL-100]|uniref:DUF6415 family natural product biosynthesis protein n=1 Tax=Streptomyces sp. ISL-100 TaxID=2819173 RepID=UPI001BEBAF91|nr:DUF6415 family natural product biosynthesis protein [Streptomyces sp. ISL-100]MBT2396243.1 hypothetical protein [Streptomyces sp. ISL-100]
MTSLTPTVSDKVEILALVETALSWDVDSPALPAVKDALDMARQFTDYGLIVADDLQTQIFSFPADSDLCISAQATLGEASRRLHLKPLAQSAAPRSAAHRAQNLARLVQALNRTISEVGREQARTRPMQAPQRE